MSAKDSVIDKRKHVRLAIRIRYHLTVKGLTYSGMTGNISLGGVYLESLDKPMASDALTHRGEIVLVWEDVEIINAQCRVVYIGGTVNNPYPAGVGIAFEDVDAEGIDRLRAFLVDRISSR